MNPPSRKSLTDPMLSPRARQAAPYTRRPTVYERSNYMTASSPRPDHAPPASAGATPPPPVIATEAARRHGRGGVILYIFAALLFASGIFVSWQGLKANHQVEAQVKHAQKQTESTVADNVVPSAAKPSAATVQNYVVAPNVPKYLDIPKLHVHTRILSEGVTESGALAVPWNIYDTGWYNASAQPGQPGGMLVDGHSGIGNMHGVFWQLGTLVAGDAITVTRGDGRQFTYTVTKVQTVAVKKVNMASMVVSSDPAKPGLNLITCAGDRIPGTNELNERVQVYAVLNS